MKTITFNVQIQANLHDESVGKKAIAITLCRDINLILMKYDGMTGGAQILQPPRNIKVSKTSNDQTRKSKLARAEYSNASVMNVAALCQTRQSPRAKPL